MTARAFALNHTSVYIACNVSDPGHEILGSDQVRSYLAARELVGSNITLAEDALDADALASPGSGAFAWDAIYIPNGTFTFDAPGYGTIDIQIHTVRRGSLAGRRVVKVRDDSGPGGWRAIAFVSRTGNFQLWTRFLSRAENPEVIAARAVVEYLRHAQAEGGSTRVPSRTMSSVPVTATVAITRHSCFICNENVPSDRIPVGTGRRSVRNPGLCHDHLPTDDRVRSVAAGGERPVRRVVSSVSDPELARLLAEEEEIEARERQAAPAGRSRATVTYGEAGFTVLRRTPLPMAEVGEGIQ